jgi:beta-carotene hydroxylase
MPETLSASATDQSNPTTHAQMRRSMDNSTILRAAQQYMGKTAWPTVAWSVLVLAAYGAVLYVGLTHQMPLALSFVLLSWLLYWLYTSLHEAVHSNIANNRSNLNWLNEAIGYIAGSLLGVPFTLHRNAHMAHHRATNIVGKDPDAVFEKPGLWHGISRAVLLIFNEYKEYFGGAHGASDAKTQRILWTEIAIMIGWRSMLIALGFPFETLVLGVLANLMGVVIVGTLFAWAVHTPFDKTERYQNTSTIILPRAIHGPATFMWVWQNYHSIHHLFPRVPFYQYRKLFEEIRPGMEERGAPILDMQARN